MQTAGPARSALCLGRFSSRPPMQADRTGVRSGRWRRPWPSFRSCSDEVITYHAPLPLPYVCVCVSMSVAKSSSSPHVDVTCVFRLSLLIIIFCGCCYQLLTILCSNLHSIPGERPRTRFIARSHFFFTFCRCWAWLQQTSECAVPGGVGPIAQIWAQFISFYTAPASPAYGPH